MNYYEGIKAMEIYNEACQGSEDLQKYLEQLGQLDAVKRVIDFPKLEVPPRDFLDVMKDHLQGLKGGAEAGADEKTKKQPLRRGLATETSSSKTLGGFGALTLRPGSGIVIRTVTGTSSELEDATAGLAGNTSGTVEADDAGKGVGDRTEAEPNLLDLLESEGTAGSASPGDEGPRPSPALGGDAAAAETAGDDSGTDPLKDRDPFDLLQDLNWECVSTDANAHSNNPFSAP
jgi:hypothetical protein